MKDPLAALALRFQWYDVHRQRHRLVPAFLGLDVKGIAKQLRLDAGKFADADVNADHPIGTVFAAKGLDLA